MRYKKEGNRAYFTLDGTYDYYEYAGGKWIFREILKDCSEIAIKELTRSFKTE